eukprot:10481994-Lingulodinium_polyedra.AAC.1
MREAPLEFAAFEASMSTEARELYEQEVKRRGRVDMRRANGRSGGVWNDRSDEFAERGPGGR